MLIGLLRGLMGGLYDCRKRIKTCLEVRCSSLILNCSKKTKNLLIKYPTKLSVVNIAVRAIEMGIKKINA